MNKESLRPHLDFVVRPLSFAPAPRRRHSDPYRHGSPLTPIYHPPPLSQRRSALLAPSRPFPNHPAPLPPAPRPPPSLPSIPPKGPAALPVAFRPPPSAHPSLTALPPRLRTLAPRLLFIAEPHSIIHTHPPPLPLTPWCPTHQHRQSPACLPACLLPRHSCSFCCATAGPLENAIQLDNCSELCPAQGTSAGQGLSALFSLVLRNR